MRKRLVLLPIFLLLISCQPEIGLTLKYEKGFETTMVRRLISKDHFKYVMYESVISYEVNNITPDSLYDISATIDRIEYREKNGIYFNSAHPEDTKGTGPFLDNIRAQAGLKFNFTINKYGNIVKSAINDNFPVLMLSISPLEFPHERVSMTEKWFFSHDVVKNKDKNYFRAIKVINDELHVETAQSCTSDFGLRLLNDVQAKGKYLLDSKTNKCISMKIESYDEYNGDFSFTIND